jgi:hypothetical protein
VRYVFLSAADYFGDVFATVYRAFGYDAVGAAPLSKSNFDCGQRDCSGKECLSYQLIWGASMILEKNLSEGDAWFRSRARCAGRACSG